MKAVILTCLLSLTIALPGWTAQTGAVQDARLHAQACMIGKPGDDSDVTRIIEIAIRETTAGLMLFEPDAIHIEHDSVVRFVVTNLGAVDHEFFLGSFDEVKRHQQWMRKNPDMQHADANAVTIRPGETANLVWTFSNITNLEFVCLVPGHREAGMWGVIMVHDHLAPKTVE
ncbi:cupredoxin domain-containing protein [Roseobacter weihaiensis]|uniref:cupredoxin domain-containing protein n=1 Tax=Roseobacter weihaiensis TaxID=2763262 RepID=UPI001D0B1A6A|nr:plastocyanin/azurin family copper-binding protein [Roseobacter sp. H9]